MEIGQLKIRARRDFNNAVCLMSIIPALAFVYLVAGKVASFSIFTGEAGYIVVAIMALILLGIYTGRNIIWVLITKLIDVSNCLVRTERELAERKRLAAITETVLSLGHEINNPLLVIRGALTLMEGDLAKVKVPLSVRDRIGLLKSNCERISGVMEKMSNISKPVSATVHEDIKMMDLGKSE